MGVQSDCQNYKNCKENCLEGSNLAREGVGHFLLHPVNGDPLIKISLL